MTKGKQNSQRYQSRREFLKQSLYAGLNASLAGSLLLSSCGKKQNIQKTTNIILISIDTLCAAHLGCYGYKRPTTPTLDKLASEGMLFEDVSAPSPWTLPAHASLLTGLYPNRNGLKSHFKYLPDDVVTWAEVLREHGYLTAAIINSHNLSNRYGLDRGFDDFTYVKESLKLAEPTKVEAKAHEWLSKHNGKPFFLFLHYYDVHSDYHSLPQYEKQFVRPYQGKTDGSTRQLLYFRKDLFSLDDDDAKHLIDLYDAGIRQMDDGMARLFALLEEKDLLDNTLIIVTSDHGEEFLEHGGVLHGRTQFQEIIHVPLLIRGPGIPHSKRLRHIASLVDVMPTILTLLGISPPASLDGINLCPLWQKSNAQLPQRFIFAEADHNNAIHDVKRAIRHQQYKLHYDRSSKEAQLYNLSDDPEEKVDVAHKHTQLVDTMLSSLKDFMNISKTGRALGSLSPEEIKSLKSLGYLQ